MYYYYYYNSIQADESTELFWKFSRGWNAPSKQDASDCSTAITKQASDLLTPAMSEIFKLSLTARQYSPRLETFRQMATAAAGAENEVAATSCCWATIGTEIVTSSSTIDSAIEEGLKLATHVGTLMPFDHIDHRHSSSGNISDSTLLPVVLYAPIGSTCTAEMDAAITKAAEKESRILYAWRPVLSDACLKNDKGTRACSTLGTKGNLTLHGYGVELAIKNMEYNARDDSKAAAAPEPEETILNSDEQEEEFQFKSLLDRTPALRQDLLTFRDHLLTAASQEQALNVKDLKDLGLQAAQRAVNSSDPLHVLGEIAQNFPLLVDSLSKGNVIMDIRNDAALLNLKIPPVGNQFVLVNGIPYETNDFNLYDLIDTLRQEVRLMDTLAAAGLSTTTARDAAILRGVQPAAERSGGGGGASAAARLDLLPRAENDEVVWINDLERDPAYRNLPRALMGLLQPGYMGQAPAVRRNVFNVLLAIDPSAPHGMEAALDVQTMVLQRWPIRLGIMPFLSTNSVESEKTAKLFSAIAAVHGGAAAVEFLVRCGSGMQVTDMQLPDAEYAVKLAPVAEKTFTALWKDLAKGRGSTLSFTPPAVGGAAADDDDDEYLDDYDDVEDSVTIDSKKRALAKLKPADALQHLLQSTGDISGVAQRLLTTSTALISRKGLTSTVESGGAVIFNGVVSSVRDDGGWRGAIGATWQSEMQALGQDIYLGRLSDDSEDLYQDILRLRGTLPRYNTRVMASAPKSKRNFKLQAVSDDEQQAPRQVILIGDDAGFEVISNLPVQYFISEEDDSKVDADYSSSSSIDGVEDDDGAEEENTTATSLRLVTHWVVVDPTTAAGLQLASDALQYTSSVSRIGILVNPSDSYNKTPSAPVEELVVAVAAGFGKLRTSASRADLIDLFAELAAVENVGELTFDQLTKQLPESLSTFKGGAAALVEPYRSDITAALDQYKSFLNQGLSIPAGQNAVVTNGRVVYARFMGDIVEEDFQLMDIGATKHQFASKKMLGKILSRTSALRDNTRTKSRESNKQELSDVAVVVSTILIAYQPDEVSVNVKALIQIIEGHQKSNSPLFVSTASTKTTTSSSSPLLIHAVLNPLTKTTQQFSAVFTALRTAIDPDIYVLLNPAVEYSEMPLKTFYRFVVPNIDMVTDDTSLHSISALFSTLPLHKTLTLGMDVPEGWLVEPVTAAHDLDNLRLDELEASEKYATAEFELEAIMVYGMCIDEGAVAARDYDGVHPRGVQLQLGTQAEPAMVDTLVMSNLGYFQMKAGPGVWSLRLAPGRSQELYNISGSSAANGIKSTANGGNTDAPAIVRPSTTSTGAADISVPVAITGFGDSDVLLVLHKDPARREEDVLDSSLVDSGSGIAAPSSSSMWSKVTKALTRDNSDVIGDSDDDDETIHVFTVASGHMYERLQKIMILSAIKRTKNRVKFWFIKNYMSPTMKEFVPIMAKQYGFDYEYVIF
jgi:UDP-glucose:glycoprotein glucosyltransferase